MQHTDDSETSGSPVLQIVYDHKEKESMVLNFSPEIWNSNYISDFKRQILELDGILFVYISIWKLKKGRFLAYKL